MRLDQRPYIKIFLSKVFGLDGSTDYIRSTHVIIVADDPGRFTSAHRRGGVVGSELFTTQTERVRGR